MNLRELHFKLWSEQIIDNKPRLLWLTEHLDQSSGKLLIAAITQAYRAGYLAGHDQSSRNQLIVPKDQDYI